jgi:hypothetical protein
VTAHASWTPACDALQADCNALFGARACNTLRRRRPITTSQDPANTSHCVSLLDARRGVCAFTRAEVVVVRWIACKGPGGVLLWCVRLWIAPFSLRKKYSVVPNHPSKSRFHNVDCFVERGMILDRSKVMSAGTPVQK